MSDEYTRAVLAKAENLRYAEAAAAALQKHDVNGWRAVLAAGLAALAAMIPSVSAAFAIL